MKYKVGNMVRVRTDLVQDEIYGASYIVYDMTICKGKVFEIDCVLDETYTLVGSNWRWTDEMLEDASKYKVGDIVKIRMDLDTTNYCPNALDQYTKFKGVPIKITNNHDKYKNYKNYELENIDHFYYEHEIEKVDEITVIKNRDFSVIFNRLGCSNVREIGDSICISAAYDDDLVETSISKHADKKTLETILNLYGHKVEVDDRRHITDISALCEFMQETGVLWDGKDFYKRKRKGSRVRVISVEELEDRFGVCVGSLGNVY